MDLNHENATSKLSSTKASARKTVWDFSTHMIFVELCLKEVNKGNRPASHFNKVGWTNLANNLKTRTGKDYTKLQLKNHWDSMKRDWKLYDRLMRIESGLGWDPVKKTINATSEWWDEKIQADPELAKFKDKNLEMYQEFYEPLFRDCVATGDKTKTPHQLQNEISQSDAQDDIGVTDVEGKADSDEGNVGDDVEVLFPESNLVKRRKIQNNADGRSSRGKSTIASSLEVKLDTVIEALASRSTPSIQIPTLVECMDIVSNFPGFEPSSINYNKALRIFMKKEARESFMYPPTTIDKISFLYSLIDER
ncbi:putative Myb/SANT-like domain-containing protein [Helianthus annuus]|uniref:Myb/SANT-like domain-containing protein n=2 Tax=Helianthus annuus TaxID=4232 RepID=A0A9K3IZU6_HELAN|nr:L10-interacting MYB domain-containing protein isoform X3 [Helianthus annuus]KAF5805135.1 putative Myb/SANT-like domain-containing protein [Helianthus annuus]